jgi:hypothetical protein
MPEPKFRVPVLSKTSHAGSTAAGFPTVTEAATSARSPRRMVMVRCSHVA